MAQPAVIGDQNHLFSQQGSFFASRLHNTFVELTTKLSNLPMTSTASSAQPPNSFRDKLATVDDKGNRKWVFPQKPKGRLTNYRDAVAYLLLAILFAGPFISINGYPLLMINVIKRKFIIFGQVFWPQDMYIFVLIIIAMVVFVVLFTVVYGRLFCGWVCPQTIFMENVFRKIEYWIDGDYTKQKALAKAPWTTQKMVKRVGKYVIFYAISILIANTFLAYIIGKTELFQIITEPVSQHVAGFTALLVFSGVFFMVFAYLREQVCLVACPYGRLQGVLIDRDSIVIAYDHVRGEPRGKLHKGEVRTHGDCIDCLQCVQVCPTGIDIRNGTQLECINCTACIDACDDIMDRIGKPRGLVRYDSQRAIEAPITHEKVKKTTPRSIAYSLVLVVLLGLIATLLFTRGMVGAQVSRAQGQLYQQLDNGNVTNLYNVKIINKSHRALPITLRMISPAQGTIQLVGSAISVPAEDLADGTFFIELPKSAITRGNMTLVVGIYSLIDGQEELLQTAKAKFLAPTGCFTN
jgi:cytochrome c oxidase accessory protein FixG